MSEVVSSLSAVLVYFRLLAHFCARKHALCNIKSYYEDKGSLCVFPRYLVFKDHQLRYTEIIKKHVHRAIMDESSDNCRQVVVKFPTSYCEEAHKCAAGYAPELFICGKVNSRFYMVVMEYIENAKIIRLSQRRQ